MPLCPNSEGPIASIMKPCCDIYSHSAKLQRCQVKTEIRKVGDKETSRVLVLTL